MVLRLLSFVEFASCLCCFIKFSRLRCSIKGRFHSLSHSFSIHWDLISFKYLPLSASSSFNLGHRVVILVHFPTIYVLDYYAVGSQISPVFFDMHKRFLVYFGLHIKPSDGIKPLLRLVNSCTLSHPYLVNCVSLNSSAKFVYDSSSSLVRLASE